MIPRITATRFVTPLREGGSMPGLVETSDEGMYVVKFRGAGQGVKTLIAEFIVGQLAHTLAIPAPALAFVDLPGAIARYEADAEVQDLLDASLGLNLGLDFLPGALNFDGSAAPPTELATRLLWLDAYTANIDRTWANPNLLMWHGQMYAIDHGAALFFHHSWPNRAPNAARFAAASFDLDKHVLAQVGGDPRDVHDELAANLTDPVLAQIVAALPEEWLEPAQGLDTPDEVKGAYLDHLRARLANPTDWLAGGHR